jgi:hypothetical protein
MRCHPVPHPGSFKVKAAVFLAMNTEELLHVRTLRYAQRAVQVTEHLCREGREGRGGRWGGHEERERRGEKGRDRGERKKGRNGGERGFRVRSAPSCKWIMQWL